ncbi:hypothetical protein C7C46_18970 [Streptomyces tateyamensis]|uniref:Uncharacterized protein n=1 Tax=Streptomyces tateyamensis TaxID=565073 RepID=A0A2V4N0Q9_9ACTN|nr:hypothetical protein [Streptomyces tateyamensis]PYC77329.1 hypothetical protein C7C46_18970 [Streptomyces tateyamensis]
MAPSECPECVSLARELRAAEATFRPKVPGGRYTPDGSALTDARVKIRQHAQVCPTAPVPAKISGAL